MIGKKTGGRTKGTPNKRTTELQEAVAAAGETPLDYMLRVMRDSKADSTRRDDMAKAAANYVHSRLANVEASLTGKDGGAITFTWLPVQSP